MALLEKQLLIKESNIPGAGQGLYTTDFIPKGTRILEYKGRIRTWKDVENEADNYYILFVTKKHVIDAKRQKKSLGRYINDAKGLTKIKGINNNGQFVTVGKRVFVEATKDIPAGTEIFVSYGKEYWDVMRKNLKIDGQQKKRA